MKLDKEHTLQKKWINVPLYQCLSSVYSSCPDQLMYKDAAVFSANFDANATVENWSPLHDTHSNIVWEAHGLLSAVIHDTNLFATGKIIPSTSQPIIDQIQVLIQLQPVLLISPSSENHLPPMRSLLEYKSSSLALPWNDRLPALQKSVNHNNVGPTRYEKPSFQDGALDHSGPVLKKHKPSQVKIRCITSTGSTDTFFHQSRRKKRDTKPPNATDIRPFIEVKKKNGQYLLPAEVDSWTVLNLGTVIWDRAAFHNQRYIYPVGYRVKKWYRSMIDPHSDTQYTCEILDGGEEPIFQLNADDNPTECWRGPTPTTVWTIVVRRAFAIRNMEYGHNPVGPDFFGLRKNTIAKMIQDLPNTDKCKNYIYQNFEAMTQIKGKTSKRSGTRNIPDKLPSDERSSTGSVSDHET